VNVTRRVRPQAPQRLHHHLQRFNPTTPLETESRGRTAMDLDRRMMRVRCPGAASCCEPSPWCVHQPCWARSTFGEWARLWLLLDDKPAGHAVCVDVPSSLHLLSCQRLRQSRHSSSSSSSSSSSPRTQNQQQHPRASLISRQQRQHAAADSSAGTQQQRPCLSRPLSLVCTAWWWLLVDGCHTQAPESHALTAAARGIVGLGGPRVCAGRCRGARAWAGGCVLH
jgi:hypothetical protein